jgi:hypothetical protein
MKKRRQDQNSLGKLDLRNMSSIIADMSREKFAQDKGWQ